MSNKRYLDYIFSPLGLKRTKKVLHVNPTIRPVGLDNVPVEITVHEYNNTSLEVVKLNRIEDCFQFLHSPTISWINIGGLRKEDVENVCSHFGVHPLISEDILSVGQRPKMDEINGLVFCLMTMLSFNEDHGTVETEQISIVLGKNFVLSFQQIPGKDVFKSLRDKLKINSSKIRQSGADFLFYSLIDAMVDYYFVVMEKLGERIEVLEEQIIRYANNKSLAHINMIRKEMILLKRNITPAREVVGGLLRSDNELIEEKTEKYFKDVYDHVIQANDLAENYRDMMLNLQDLYLSNVNLRLNEVMKVMAIVTCLLAPATVIGGIFGMNFDKIPLLHNQWGFFISVAVMLIVPVFMIVIFKKRGWF